MKTLNSTKKSGKLMNFFQYLKNVWITWKEKRINKKILRTILHAFHIKPDTIHYKKSRQVFEVKWVNDNTNEHFTLVFGTGILKTSPHPANVMVIWAGGTTSEFESRLTPYAFNNTQQYFDFITESNFIVNSFKSVIS